MAIEHDRRGSMAAGRSPAARPLSRQTGAFIRDVARLLWFWLERRRSRRDLATLSDAGLRDIGLTREQALGEWSKPFWRD